MPRSPRAILFFTVFVDLAGLGMLLPLLPFYASRYGASAFQVGVLFASYSLAQAVCAPLLGRLSDRWGRRPVLLAAIAVNGSSHLLFAAAASFPVLLVARVVSGMAAANFSIAQAYVADVTAPEERTKGMGLVGAALGLGFVAGPALGGALSLHSQVAVPLGAALLAFGNLIVVVVRLPESLPPDQRGPALGSWLPLADLARVDRFLLPLLLLFFATLFAFATMEATLALFCEARFGFGVAETSALLVFLGVVIATVQGGLVGPLSRRLGERRLVLVGIVVMGGGLLALAQAPTVAAVVVAGALLAFGSGVYNPSLMSLVSRASAPREQGRNLGLARSMGALARATGPVWGGWVFDAWGPAWPFVTGAVVMALGLALAWGVVPGPRPTAARDSASPAA